MCRNKPWKTVWQWPFHTPPAFIGMSSLHTVVTNNCDCTFAAAKQRSRHSLVAEAPTTCETSEATARARWAKIMTRYERQLNSHQSPLTPSLGPAPPPCCLALRLPGAARLHDEAQRSLCAPPAGGHTQTHTDTRTRSAVKTCCSTPSLNMHDF